MDEKRNVLAFLKNRRAVLLLFAAGILMLLAGSFMHAAENIEEAEFVSYASVLESKIRILCLSVDGIESVHVMVTLAERDFVGSVSNGGFISDTYTYTLVRSDGKGNTVTEIHPVVAGVAIVCTDGDNPQMQLKLSELLSAALGIPVAKISICGAKPQL